MAIPITSHIGKMEAAVLISGSALYIMYPHRIVPKIGNQGQNGTLKALLRFGYIYLRITIPKQTNTKDVNVPNTQSSAATSLFKNNIPIIINIVDAIVITYGVLYVGWTLLITLGKKPSRAIAYKILEVPKIRTIRTDVKPAKAPPDIAPANQP